MSETLTMANPIETEKIRTHHAKIVVEYTTGEPYYSIEWFDPAKNVYRLGYSSYYIDNVAAWLAEYFEIVEKPKTNADRIRAMSDEELAEFISSCGCPDHARDCRKTCTDCVMKWLGEPAEGE
jgi:hypothetical protein